jgi:hypothetical protein
LASWIREVQKKFDILYYLFDNIWPQKCPGRIRMDPLFIGLPVSGFMIQDYKSADLDLKEIFTDP